MKNQNSKQKKEKSFWKKEFFEWIQAILFALAISFVLRSFVFTLVLVNGKSMEPTLHSNDKLYVNRFFYKPKRGDIIVFTPKIDSKHPYVKRVIAIEDDKIFMDFENGHIYINNKIIDEPYIKDLTTRSEKYTDDLIEKGKYSKDKPIIVGKDEVFAMGDNRSDSHDCRALGPISNRSIIGKAIFRMWPIDRIGFLYSNNMKFKND
ncbi:MAG: signal peptidase I [Clostridiales bacterium]|jgi:signal peptidase I|nr:signal peptidase I [Clostridiales bacterium]